MSLLPSDALSAPSSATLATEGTRREDDLHIVHVVGGEEHCARSCIDEAADVRERPANRQPPSLALFRVERGRASGHISRPELPRTKKHVR